MSNSDLPYEARKLRLLVLEDFTAAGGIQTVTRSLIPELSTRCDKLIWLMPEHSIEKTKSSLYNPHSIIFAPLHAKRWQSGWYLQVVASRINRYRNSSLLKLIGKKLEHHAKLCRLKSIARQYGLTHLLNIAVFNQTYPNIGIPVSGIIYDTNYSPSWKLECESNLKSWVSKADVLFTISNWSKNQILNLEPLAISKLNAVNLAITTPRFDNFTNAPDSTNNLTSFLYPATFNSHKNHLDLLKALHDLYLEGYLFSMTFCGFNTELLLSSQSLVDDELETARFFLESTNPDFRACIRALGMVDQQSLEELFHNASYVLLPTKYEGFGLPLIEAIVRGVPVLCSDIPPFREQVENYGLHNYVTFVDGFGAMKWKESIRKKFSNTIKSNLLLPEMHEAFEKWSWGDVADSYLSIIQRFTS